MRRALEVARGNPQFPFGAVIVRKSTGEILAEGLNHSQDGQFWHGEIDAIDRCGRQHPKLDWSDTILYTTAEPCPMCQSAILWAGIPMVVYGTSITQLKTFGWRQIDIRAKEVAARWPHHRCEVIGGVLQAECDQLFRR